MNLEPGTVKRFTPEDVDPGEEGAKFSSHDVGLLEVVKLARALDRSSAGVVIIGIQPKEITWGIDLSPEVQAAVPRAVEMILKEINRIGQSPQRQSH